MTSIEITFLGTTAGVPTKNRNHSSIYLKYKSENEFCFLFDCGEGTQKQIFSSDLNFMRLNEIFITHWHADHFAGLLGLIETMSLENRNKPLYIFAPEAEKFVPMLLNLGYSTKKFHIVPKNVWFEGTHVQKIYDNDEFSIASIPVKHGIPAVAYAFVEKDRIKIDKEKAKDFGLPSQGQIYKKIKDDGKAVFKGKEIRLEDISLVEKGKKVVYSGDTLPCKNIVTIAKDADLLIHDSTYFSEEQESRHASFEEVVKISKEADVKEVVLTHISRRYQDYDDLMEKIKKHQNFRIAKDFMTVVV
ncbi:MAG: ribonuclease Z [Candidatus Aenigmatarchaeota archaeon]